MTALPKGIAIISLAIVTTVLLSSTAHAASLFGIFGSNDRTGSQNTSDNQSQSRSGMWGNRHRTSDTDRSNGNTPSSPSTNPTTSDDTDKDGLSAAQETEQKTSNITPDTDNDGLSDFVESRWNTQRDALFCGAECAYPDPLTKDIYIETDWIVLSNGVSARPTTNQIGWIVDAFKKHDINVYIDRGQYGGGNQVPHTAEMWFSNKAGEVDLGDYKRGGDGIAAQFDQQREKVYHYMLIGERYKMMQGNLINTGSTGMANLRGPNSLVAYGTISSYVPEAGRELAKASTMMHELGHNLCLTEEAVGSIPAECVFAGIDNPSARQPDSIYKDYKSIMSPRYTFKLVDYSSNPTNSPNDHNDWAALKLTVFGR